MSDVLRDAITPTRAVELLAERGIKISERTLRARARKIGACRLLGRTMLLLPEHIDLIFAEPLMARSLRIQRRHVSIPAPPKHRAPRSPAPKPDYPPVIMRKQ